MMRTESKLDDETEDEAFLRSLVLPEEERRRFTSVPYSGGWRWFKSPNVVDLVTYRAKIKDKDRRQRQ
jgi:hypothetical protein